MDKLQVFVVAHKQFQPPADWCYKPIAVGTLQDTLGFELSDSTGANISSKNPNYCELTAHYWIWKNTSSDLVGLCHYRRYFSKGFLHSIIGKVLPGREFVDYLQSADILLPRRIFWKDCTVAEAYYNKGEGRSEDLEVTRDVIREYAPSYLKAFDAVMQSHSASYCNMLVTRRELFVSYSEWLFSILSEVEKRVDLTGYTPAEARIFGYLSEILLNVWVMYQKLNVKYLGVFQNDANCLKRAVWELKNTARRLGIQYA